jgi:hypothetical protein
MNINISRISLLFASAAMVFSMAACDDDESHVDVLSMWNWDRQEVNQDVTEAGWTNVGAEFGSLPAYINVYKSPDTFDGTTQVVAYLAVANLPKATFGITGDIHWSDAAGGNGNESVYTLTEFYGNNGSPTIIINGGLFFESGGFYYSQSSAYKDGVMLSPNQNYWSENWTDFWYPTIGFFYEKQDGTFEATWTYYASDGNDYSYEDVKKIDLSTPETEAPDADTPSTGTVMNDGTAVNGIGGVSVLIHDGVIRNTWADELLDVSADSAQPRTAVGYDANNMRLYFFVCEGRGMTENVPGLTTAQVAEILKSAGCTEALNLDGGGSSCMLVNGKETIKPSDGSQRAVLDACYIK